MAFVIVFILGGLAFPLFIEIYRKGADNLLARSGKEVARSKFVMATVKAARGIHSMREMVFGAVTLLVMAGAFSLTLLSVEWLLHAVTGLFHP